MICAQQIKAARAWLDWTRETLAEESGISPATIRNLECGKIAPRSAEVVRLAFENKGFTFHGKNGLTRETAENRIFDGTDSGERFFDYMLSGLREKGGELAVVFKKQTQLLRALGVGDPSRLERLGQLCKLVTVKCLLSEENKAVMAIPPIEFRATAHGAFGLAGQFIYGDVTATVTPNGGDYVYHVLKSVDGARTVWKDFTRHWEAALPLVTQPIFPSKNG
jgi:DNA-binding XRE family transcriptional regulator